MGIVSLWPNVGEVALARRESSFRALHWIMAKVSKSALKTRPPPAFQPFQLATLVDHVPAGSGWVHDVKALVKRASSKALRDWGQAAQLLPKV